MPGSVPCYLRSKSPGEAPSDGRLNRLHPDKQEVRIYEYVDAGVSMLAAMYRKRLKGYRAMGYVVREESAR